MKPHALFVALLCWFTLSFATTSYALTIPASEDSYTASGNKLNNLTSNANSLIVDATRKSYLYFDLSDIPADAVVRWAKLRLFLPTVRTAGAGLSVHLVTGTWNESTRLADVPSIVAGSLAMIAPDKMASRRFVTVDVKNTVQKWINGGTLNEGLAIQPIVKAGSPTASVMLTSKEGPVFGLPAELDIEFDPIISAGPQGEKGQAGAIGPVGPRGEKGDTGAVGPQGMKGDMGMAGPQGIQGVAGLDGKTVLGGTIEPSSSIGNDGDFYINTTTSVLYGPKTDSEWGSGTSLVGPKGGSGPTGPQGIQGAAGVAGPMGPRGETGAQGIQGAAGPKGETGAQGLTGPRGEKGDAGAPPPFVPLIVFKGANNRVTFNYQKEYWMTWDIVSDSIFKIVVYKDDQQIGAFSNGVVSGDVNPFSTSSTQTGSEIIDSSKGIRIRYKVTDPGRYYLRVSNGSLEIKSEELLLNNIFN